MSSSFKVSKYKKHETNPFVDRAIEEINGNITKKYRTASGYDEKAVLHAVDPKTGESLGHTTFIRQIEVDEEKFTKIYLSQFQAFWDLGKQAIRVFSYIMTRLVPGQDQFIFLKNECLTHTGYKHKNSIFIGLGQLLESEIIARGPADTIYYINPLIAFNGNRVTFAKSYVKKQKPKSNPAQLGVFETEEERLEKMKLLQAKIDKQ